ncbi:MAG: hypothetical protein KKB37_07685 [Alphaproteobacteria bacterium]|nr:hypothetical protein [Alphaproteobacteria bacterium]
MTMKSIIIATASAFIATAGVAHAAENPEMPSQRECEKGYKEGMKWTRAEFDEACTKVRTNAVPAGQTK